MPRVLAPGARFASNTNTTHLYQQQQQQQYQSHHHQQQQQQQQPLVSSTLQEAISFDTMNTHHSSYFNGSDPHAHRRASITGYESSLPVHSTATTTSTSSTSTTANSSTIMTSSTLPSISGLALPCPTTTTASDLPSTTSTTSGPSTALYTMRRSSMTDPFLHASNNYHSSHLSHDNGSNNNNINNNNTSNNTSNSNSNNSISSKMAHRVTLSNGNNSTTMVDTTGMNPFGRRHSIAATTMAIHSGSSNATNSSNSNSNTHSPSMSMATIKEYEPIMTPSAIGSANGHHSQHNSFIAPSNSTTTSMSSRKRIRSNSPIGNGLLSDINTSTTMSPTVSHVMLTSNGLNNNGNSASIVGFKRYGYNQTGMGQFSSSPTLPGASPSIAHNTGGHPQPSYEHNHTSMPHYNINTNNSNGMMLSGRRNTMPCITPFKSQHHPSHQHPYSMAEESNGEGHYVCSPDAGGNDSSSSSPSPSSMTHNSHGSAAMQGTMMLGHHNGVGAGNMNRTRRRASLAVFNNIDASHHGHHSGNGPRPEAPYARSPELRITHKLAERRRRQEMKELFDDLREALPVEPHLKTSKWEILTKALETIHSLRDQQVDMADEIKLLRQQLNNAGIAPVNGPSSSTSITSNSMNITATTNTSGNMTAQSPEQVSQDETVSATHVVYTTTTTTTTNTAHEMKEEAM